MALEVGEVVGGGDGFYAFDDLTLGEGGESFLVVGFVGEDVCFRGGAR